MIKNIAYFPAQCAKNSGPVVNAVLDSLQSRGIQTQENSMTADAAVIWSVLWHGRMASNQQVYEHYRGQGKPVIVIEIGALYRGRTWKLAVNNITSQGYYGHQINLDPDRPRKLGMSIAISTSTNPAILIATQHNRSHQLAGVDQEAWITDTIQQLREHTDRPIHVRAHPRSTLQWNRLPTDIVPVRPVRMINTYDNFDMHFDYHSVVNYNSGPGIQAAISGTRPIVDATSLAYPVAHTIAQIDQPYQINRDQWLIEICHTEYTVEELQKGTWLKRIESALTA